MNYRDEVRKYIVNNLLFGNNDKLTDSGSLLDAGIIDSTGILEIVQFIEETFKIKLNDDELLPENLDNIDAIARFVERKARQQ